MKERYERLKKRMAEERLDVAIAISPENSYYYMNTYVVTQTTLRDRIGMGVFPLESEPALIACSIEKGLMELETWIEDRRFYTEFRQSPMTLLADILREKGLAGKRIGIETDYLSTMYYLQLKELLPEAEIVSCTHVLKRVRMVKEPDEIAKIRYAAKHACVAIESAIADTSVGDTEHMLDYRIKSRMLQSGAQTFTFFCMGTGAKSMYAHALPDQTRFEDGEIMRLDYGVLYEHYNADIARTVMIGKPNQVYLDTFRRLCEVYAEVVARMKAGVTSRELYELCEKRCKEKQLQFTMPHIGHSLGIDLHEEPMLSPVGEFALEENMVFNVEPMIVVENRCYHIEDTILVKRDGNEVLSQEPFQPGMLYIR